MKSRLVVVRHGETEWNVAGRIQGHTDSPLTPSGRAQAEAIGERMAKESFERLVSSDLGRAWQTAEAIAKRTGHAIVANPRIRERHFGEGEGLTYEEVDARWPEAFSRTRETDPDYVIPGGESRRQLHERIRDEFESLAREAAGGCHAVVCHGGVLAILYRHIHGIPVGEARRIPIPNASYNALRHEGGRWIVEAWGDTAHLPAVGEALVEP
ncbi:MAG: histidine phosphatase family protein [Betaproteobacteria bacterium]|nr:histidine phosphatase family protein [Betaproteobacteria bacterium]